MLQRPGAIVAGKYRLEKPLARGGVGTVWTARHVQLQQLVAVKFLDPTIASSPQVRTRFEREARATANLKSPHVVQVFDYGVQGDTPYLVMELLRGETLHARLRRDTRLGMVETYSILAQIGKGLRRAHEDGFVHRDLKPANIYMAKGDDDDTVVKILDFGIAKETSGELIGESTRTGELVGSPHYMSPEQIRGEREVDARSDLWALGVIVYRALTGYLPFPGDVLTAVITKIVVDPIPSATQYLPGAPASLEGFFETALARDKSRRFQTVGALVRAFGEVAAEASGMQLFGPGSGAGRGSLPSFPEFGTPNGIASSIPGASFVPLGQLPQVVAPPRAVPGGATLQAAPPPPQASQSGASMSAVPPPRPPQGGVSVSSPPARAPQAGASVSVSSPPARAPQAGASVSVSSPPAKAPQVGASVSVSRPPARPPQAGASVSVAGPPAGTPQPGASVSVARPPARPPQAGAAPLPSTPPPSSIPTILSAGVAPPAASPGDGPVSVEGEPLSLPEDSISLHDAPISLHDAPISLDDKPRSLEGEPRFLPPEPVTVLGTPLFGPGALLSLPDEPVTVPRVPTPGADPPLSPPVVVSGSPSSEASPAIPAPSTPASHGPASQASLSVSLPASGAAGRPSTASPAPRRPLWIFAVGGVAVVLLVVAFGALRSRPAASGAPSGEPRAASPTPPPPVTTPDPIVAKPPTEAVPPVPAPSESSTTSAPPSSDTAGRPAPPALSGKVPAPASTRPRPASGKKPIDTID